jgi:hypothetical protein
MKLRTAGFSLAAFVAAAIVGLTAQPSAASSTFQAATAQPTAQATVDASKSALLRIINASPDAGAIDLYVDKGDKPSVSNLDYAYGTDGYQVITGGDHHITITATGDPKTVVFDSDATFPAGSANTLLIQGSVAEKSLLVRNLTDDVSDTAGKARIKISNSIVDGGSVDLVSADFKTTYSSDIAYGNTDIISIDPGTYDMLIVPKGSKDAKSALVTITGAQLVADQIYTILAIGSAKTASSIKPLVFTTSPVAGFKPPVFAAATPAATAAK